MHNEDDMKHDAHEPATKGDLERFATKDDHGRLERVVRNIAVEVSGIKAELTDFRQDILSALARTESRLISHMDGFMAKTLKVERDEFWLIHRMDKLEDRVDRIEKKSP